MPHSSSLVLTTPEAYRDGRPDAGPLPPGIPPVFEDGSRVLSYGLLLGEVLGVDTGPAVELLELSARATALRRELEPDVDRILYGDDLAVLRDALRATADAGEPAIDEHGRPRGELGERLAGSDHVRIDEHGQALIGTRRIRVGDLLDRAGDLAEFLDVALQRDLIVVFE
jgi:hypothetical protein